MKKRTVYLVGAGPGDVGLTTVRGLELIKKADCIIYDYLVSPGLLGFRKDGCKLIYAGKKAGSHTLTQDKINRLLVKEAKVYPNVVRLKGGDPFIFGRGAEEAAYLKKKKIDFEIVPGISSAIAVPAYAGIPLTERSKNSTVGFITGHEDPAKIDSSIDWSALVRAIGTMVFLMGVGNLGLYDTSYKIASVPITEFSDALSRVTFPVYSKIKDDKPRLLHAFVKTTLGLSALVIPFGVFLFFFPQIVVLLLGPNWEPAVPVLRVLSVLGIVRAISGSSSALFLAVNKANYVTFVTLASIIGLAVTIIPFVSNFGLTGAAASAILGSLLALPLFIYFIRSVFKK